jgi:homocitrate synthase NifV
MTKTKKYLLDTTLRDGEQSPFININPQQKFDIAMLLDTYGIHQIEAGIPAISKTEKATISKIIEKRKSAVISVWSRLIPEDIKDAIDVSPDIIHVTIPVSYVHIYTKLRKNKTWLVNQLYACLEVATAKNAQLSVGFEDAFRSEHSFMVKIANILFDYGINRIRIADTVGIATPTACRKLIEDFNADTECKAKLGFHAHNDFGMAVANTIETAKSGCIYADVTVGGVGERAGNCDLAKLVYATSGIFDWGIGFLQAMELEERILQILNS